MTKDLNKSLRYNYEFSIWIDGKNSKPCKEITSNLLRRALSYRQVEENITQKEFENLREELWHLGFELHEITRIPHIVEETVK